MVLLHTAQIQTLSTTKQPPDGSQVTRQVGLPTNLNLLSEAELTIFDSALAKSF